MRPGPRAQISPTTPDGRRCPVPGSTMRLSVPGSGGPTVSAQRGFGSSGRVWVRYGEGLGLAEADRDGDAQLLARAPHELGCDRRATEHRQPPARDVTGVHGLLVEH